MSDTTREDLREAFKAWAKDRDERHAGKIAANGLDYPLGRVLEEAWQAAWTASRQKALQEAEKMRAVIQCAKYVAFSNGFDAAYPDKLEALRAAIRSLGGITSNEGERG